MFSMIEWSAVSMLQPFPEQSTTVFRGVLLALPAS